MRLKNNLHPSCNSLATITKEVCGQTLKLSNNFRFLYIILLPFKWKRFFKSLIWHTHGCLNCLKEIQNEEDMVVKSKWG
jgi:hypothetical protein